MENHAITQASNNGSDTANKVVVTVVSSQILPPCQESVVIPVAETNDTEMSRVMNTEEKVENQLMLTTESITTEANAQNSSMPTSSKNSSNERKDASAHEKVNEKISKNLILYSPIVSSETSSSLTRTTSAAATAATHDSPLPLMGELSENDSLQITAPTQSTTQAIVIEENQLGKGSGSEPSVIIFEQPYTMSPSCLQQQHAATLPPEFPDDIPQEKEEPLQEIKPSKPLPQFHPTPRSVSPLAVPKTLDAIESSDDSSPNERLLAIKQSLSNTSQPAEPKSLDSLSLSGGGSQHSCASFPAAVNSYSQEEEKDTLQSEDPKEQLLPSSAALPPHPAQHQQQPTPKELSNYQNESFLQQQQQQVSPTLQELPPTPTASFQQDSTSSTSIITQISQQQILPQSPAKASVAQNQYTIETQPPADQQDPMQHSNVSLQTAPPGDNRNHASPDQAPTVTAQPLPVASNLSGRMRASPPVARIPTTATVQVVRKKGRFSLLKETPAGVVAIAPPAGLPASSGELPTPQQEASTTDSSQQLHILSSSEQQQEVLPQQQTSQQQAAQQQPSLQQATLQQPPPAPQAPLQQSLLQATAVQVQPEQQAAVLRSAGNSPVPAVRTKRKGRFTLIQPEGPAGIPIHPAQGTLEQTSSVASSAVLMTPPLPHQEVPKKSNGVPTVKKKGRFVVSTLAGPDLANAAAQAATAQATTTAAVVADMAFPSVVSTQTQVAAPNGNDASQSSTQTLFSATPAVMVTQQSPAQAQNVSNGDQVHSILQATYTTTPAMVVTQAQAQAVQNCADLSQNFAQATYSSSPAVLMVQGPPPTVPGSDYLQSTPLTNAFATPALMVTQTPRLGQHLSTGEDAQNVTRGISSHGTAGTQGQAQTVSQTYGDPSHIAVFTTAPAMTVQAQTETLGNDASQNMIQSTCATTTTMMATQSQGSPTNRGGKPAQGVAQCTYAPPTVMVSPASQFLPQQLYYANTYQQPIMEKTSSTMELNANHQQPQQPLMPSIPQQSGIGASTASREAAETIHLTEGDQQQRTTPSNGAGTLNTGVLNAQNQRQRRKPPVKPVGLPRNQGLVGQPGLGKVLYFLDQMRSEVSDADKMIKSLTTDMRCLKEKNKELEAKGREFERRYYEEKTLREAAEEKLKALRNKFRELEVEMQSRDLAEVRKGSHLSQTPSCHGRDLESDSLASQPDAYSNKCPKDGSLQNDHNAETKSGDVPEKNLPSRRRTSSSSFDKTDTQDGRIKRTSPVVTTENSTPPRDPTIKTLSPRPNPIEQRTPSTDSTGRKLPLIPNSQGRNAGYESGRSSGNSSPHNGVFTPVSSASKPGASLATGSEHARGPCLTTGNASNHQATGIHSGTSSPALTPVLAPFDPSWSSGKTQNVAERQESAAPARSAVEAFDPLRMNTQLHSDGGSADPTPPVSSTQVFAVPLMSLATCLDGSLSDRVGLQSQSIMTYSQQSSSQNVMNLTEIQQPTLQEGKPATRCHFQEMHQPMVFFPQIPQPNISLEQVLQPQMSQEQVPQPQISQEQVPQPQMSQASQEQQQTLGSAQQPVMTFQHSFWSHATPAQQIWDQQEGVSALGLSQQQILASAQPWERQCIQQPPSSQEFMPSRPLQQQQHSPPSDPFEDLVPNLSQGK